jgi:hypothetical protein
VFLWGMLWFITGRILWLLPTNRTQDK